MSANEPLEFTGGDFVLGDWSTQEELTRIPFKNNSAVIFPSRIWHKVTPVSHKSEQQKTARFTIQYWPGLKNLLDV